MIQAKDIVHSGAISFSWILNSSKIAKENDSFKQILNNYESQYGEKVNNGATLLAFAYLALVFPKESDLISDISDINYQNFEIIQDDRQSVNNIQDFLRRLRNAISHANIEIDNNGNFIFSDGLPNINFKVIISANNFGNFLVNILAELEKKLKN